MAATRWLHVVDGSPYSGENSAGVMSGNIRGFGRNLNPNLLPLGRVSVQGGGRMVKKRDGCIDNLTANGIVQGEMELDLEEENEPLELAEGKKRQQIVERGLSLGWKGNILVKLKSYSSFHVDVEVHDNECGNIWRFTG
ncbi:hypothetical protein Gotur_001314, partial [Gossypium turneri]